MLGGNLEAQRWVQFFQIEVGGKQIRKLDAEYLGQKEQFTVRRPSKLGFKFRDRLTTDIPTFYLQLCRKRFLGPVLLVAEFPHLWTN